MYNVTTNMYKIIVVQKNQSSYPYVTSYMLVLSCQSIYYCAKKSWSRPSMVHVLIDLTVWLVVYTYLCTYTRPACRPERRYLNSGSTPWRSSEYMYSSFVWPGSYTYACWLHRTGRTFVLARNFLPYSYRSCMGHANTCRCTNGMHVGGHRSTHKSA